VALGLLTAAMLHFAPAMATPVIGTDNVEAIKENKRVAIERLSIEFYEPESAKDKQTAINKLSSLIGGGSEREVVARS